jgi:hypothetical protein
VDDNLHTTIASRHQLYINIWVGILGDQTLGPVVLPNRVTGAVYHHFLVNDLPVLLEHNAPSSMTTHLVHA